MESIHMFHTIICIYLSIVIAPKIHTPRHCERIFKSVGLRCCFHTASKQCVQIGLFQSLIERLWADAGPINVFSSKSIYTTNEATLSNLYAIQIDAHCSTVYL